MGACGSSVSAQEAQALAVSKQIDRKNREAYQLDQGRIKMLLLGAGESGKSTILKQMKILYGKGFGHQSADELARWRSTVTNNILSNLKMLLDQVEAFEDESLEDASAEVKAQPYGIEAKLTPELGETIAALWADEGVQNAWHARGDFQVQDALRYYCEDIKRIAKPDYQPTEQDILRTRVRTSGIVEEMFTIDGVEFAFFDVGGQRNERKKWVHAFDSVTAVIFVAAINEYNQKLFEDNTMNRIDEAVILFDEICNSPFFRNTAMILFLNKKDLFREKLAEVPFRVDDGPEARFTDYNGPQVNFEDESGIIGSPEYERCYDATKRYLTQLFINRNKNPKMREIYTHVTNATSTDNIQVVWAATRDIVLQRNLAGSGFGV